MSYTNFNIGQNTENYETSEVFDTYGRIDIMLGEDEEGNVITVSYPDISDDQVGGRIMTVSIPMCTDTTLAMTAAQRIYNSLTTGNATGFQYQPMKASGTLADPSMEFGDGVDINGVHSGFYTRDVNFGKLMRTDLTSPSDEEIDHEYPYQDAQQRQITRTNKELKSGLYVTSQAITAEVAARIAADATINATLEVQAGQIAARVTKTGGNNSSFGWVLNDTSHTWYSGSQEVMRVNKDGLYVKGEISAAKGLIGGFTIGATSIYSNGMSSMSSAQSTGVHLGTDGIKLGQNFKVDTGGNLTASRGTFGSLSVSGSGSSYSGGLNGCGGSVSSGLTYSGGGVSYGSLGSLDSNLKDTALRVGTIEANYITADYITADLVSAKMAEAQNITLAGYRIAFAHSSEFGNYLTWW